MTTRSPPRRQPDRVVLASRHVPAAPVQQLTRLCQRPELVIVAVAAAVRLVWVALVSRNVPIMLQHGDQYSYWYYGREIAAGRGYLSYVTGEASAYYPVGYPLLLASWFWAADLLHIPGGDPILVGVLQATLGAVTVWLVHVVGAATFGRRVGLVAAAVLAVFPSVVYAAATYSVESAFIALTLATLAIAVTHDWSTPPSWQRAGALAVTFAAAVMVRPFALPSLAIVALAAWRGRGWRAAAKVVGTMIGVLALVATPWVIRNEVRFGAFIPFSTNLGDTMCMSRFPGSTAEFSWAVHEWCADPDLPEHVRSGENIKMALRFIRAHPDEEARLIVARFREMMAHDHESLSEAASVHGTIGGRAFTWLARLADWTFVIASASALVGVALLGRRRLAETNVQSVLLTAGYLLAIPLGLWGAVRFHAPLVPFIVLFAAFAGVELLARMRAEARPDDQEVSAAS